MSKKKLIEEPISVVDEPVEIVPVDESGETIWLNEDMVLECLEPEVASEEPEVVLAAVVAVPDKRKEAQQLIDALLPELGYALARAEAIRVLA